MRVALVNPPWSFAGSIYFGCREPHLPLEFGYSKALLEAEGHEAVILDAQMDGLDDAGLRERLADFRPDMTVLTTAPSYLFWRCPPPELRVPRRTAAALRDVAGRLVAVGPHASTTPGAVLRKIGADLAVRGECEQVLARLAAAGDGWREVESIAYADGAEVRTVGGLAATDMSLLPALRWPTETLARHRHHHHRFDAEPDGPGAEVEASRGCPFTCTFCAKDNYRDRYRRRTLEAVLEEIDGVVAGGATYVYFIDEIFQPWRALLLALAERPVSFGVQLRIDVWSEEQLELLGAAGCRSIETGVESISAGGRRLIDKNCRKTTDELVDLLVHARRHVPFVQASLIDVGVDDPGTVDAFRNDLLHAGVWANKPVPLFPYPGSPDYARQWGAPDDQAWERAHERYLELHREFSDVQDDAPLPLPLLESVAHDPRAPHA